MNSKTCVPRTQSHTVLNLRYSRLHCLECSRTGCSAQHTGAARRNKMNERTCTRRKAKHVVPKYLWYNSLLSPKPSSRDSCKHHHPNPAAPTPHYASHRHRQPVLLTGSTQPRGERVGLAAVTRDCLWLLRATVCAQAQRRRLSSASLLQRRGSFPRQQGRPRGQVKRREPQSTRGPETLAVFSMLLLGVASPQK